MIIWLNLVGGFIFFNHGNGMMIPNDFPTWVEVTSG